eukprot:Nk52_evm14s218 gene=Nk52_evmTU14s218
MFSQRPFRSEEMTLIQLFIQSDSAFHTVSALGEIGLVEFIDLNKGRSPFQRAFVKEIRRCEELERKLRLIRVEVDLAGLEIEDIDEETQPVPEEDDMEELENICFKLESELLSSNKNQETMLEDYERLVDLKAVLESAPAVQNNSSPLPGMGREQPYPVAPVNNSSTTALLSDEEDFEGEEGHELRGRPGDGDYVRTVGGVIAREKMEGFRRLMWRACHGNVFLRDCQIQQHPSVHPIAEEALADRGRVGLKNAFFIYFQGEMIEKKVQAICQGYGAMIFPYPSGSEERMVRSLQVSERLNDLERVLERTKEYRRRILIGAAQSLSVWNFKISCLKAIYCTLNSFSIDVTEKCVIAEGWAPVEGLTDIQNALFVACERACSTVPSVLNRMNSVCSPPTYHTTNKFTAPF